MAQTTGSRPSNASLGHSGTVLESDEDIRQALLSALKGPAGTAGRSQPRRPPPRPPAVPASPFRPTARPAGRRS